MEIKNQLTPTRVLIATAAAFCVGVFINGTNEYIKAEIASASVSHLPADQSTIPVIEAATQQRKEGQIKYIAAAIGIVCSASALKKL